MRARLLLVERAGQHHLFHQGVINCDLAKTVFLQIKTAVSDVGDIEDAAADRRDDDRRSHAVVSAVRGRHCAKSAVDLLQRAVQDDLDFRLAELHDEVLQFLH